jgi:MoaA/NifB/PqqE/SkfB family radical SAM enzyme
MSRPNWLQQDLYILWHYALSRKQTPFLASWKLTYRCNLRCRQCPFHEMESGTPSFPEVIATLQRLYRRGNRLVVFEGGEPMLWRDGPWSIRDVVAEAKKLFFCVGLTTNGTFPLEVETDVLWVSLDGLADTHNRLRGPGVFEQAIENIRRSGHPKILAHITANAVNCDEVPDLIRYLRGLVKGITVQFYYPYHGQDELFLGFDRREQLLDEILSLKRAGYPVLNSAAALEALKRNRWKCVDWLVDNANPDGSITQGCYLRGRDDIDCARCGFAPHTEISLAYQRNLQAARAGIKIFFSP